MQPVWAEPWVQGRQQHWSVGGRNVEQITAFTRGMPPRCWCGLLPTQRCRTHNCFQAKLGSSPTPAVWDSAAIATAAQRTRLLGSYLGQTSAPQPASSAAGPECPLGTAWWVPEAQRTTQMQRVSAMAALRTIMAAAGTDAAGRNPLRGNGQCCLPSIQPAWPSACIAAHLQSADCPRGAQGLGLLG